MVDRHQIGLNHYLSALFYFSAKSRLFFQDIQSFKYQASDRLYVRTLKIRVLSIVLRQSNIVPVKSNPLLYAADHNCTLIHLFVLLFLYIFCLLSDPYTASSIAFRTFS